MNKKENVVKIMDRLNEENLSKLSAYAEKLEAEQVILFSDSINIKEYVYSLNEKFFENKKYGFYWRKDKDKNISLRTKDRYGQRGEVGLNIDFNLIEKDKNISSNSFEINILVRNEKLYKDLKSNSIDILPPYTIRRKYIKSDMEGTYLGDILVENIADLENIIKICSQSLANKV